MAIYTLMLTCATNFTCCVVSIVILCIVTRVMFMVCAGLVVLHIPSSFS